jgi:membrane-associated phospholipid phosphatase
MGSFVNVAAGTILAVAVVLAFWLLVSLIDDLPRRSQRTSR